MNNLDGMLEQRKRTHGPWKEYADKAQRLRSFCESGKPGMDTSEAEGLNQILGKIARIVTGDPSEPDHWKDISGYATRVFENLEKRETARPTFPHSDPKDHHETGR